LFHSGKCIAKTEFKRELPPVFATVAAAQRDVLRELEQAEQKVLLDAARAAGITTRDECAAASAVHSVSCFESKSKLSKWEFYVQSDAPAVSAAKPLRLQLFSDGGDGAYKLEGEQVVEAVTAGRVNMIEASADLPEAQAGWLIGFKCDEPLIPSNRQMKDEGKWVLLTDPDKAPQRTYSLRAFSTAVAEEAAAAEGEEAAAAEGEEAAPAEGEGAAPAEAEDAAAAEAEEAAKAAPAVEVFESTPAVMWGARNQVTCMLDTEKEGGQLTFKIDGKLIVDLKVDNVFALLGSTKAFPCICVSPFPMEDKEEETDKAESEEEEKQLAAQVVLLARVCRCSKDVLLGMPPEKLKEILTKCLFAPS
jgi:hypothetical protein